MMDRTTALNTLRLATDASHSDIIAAYNRLARRYPLQQFPKRHTQLLDAKTALLSPDNAYKAMLFEDTLDLSWLNTYTPQVDANQTTTASDAPVTPKQCLEALCRQHFKRGPDLFAPDEELDADFVRLLNELGPDGIQEIINNM